MKWFNEKRNYINSSLIPYALLGINDEIYDEVVKKEDGFYYLIRRCGVMPYSASHGYEHFKTDKKTIIYPLNSNEITETKLSWEPPVALGDSSVILINSGQIPPRSFSGSVETNEELKEYRKLINGKVVEFPNNNGINKESYSFVDGVYGSESGIGTLVVDDLGNPILDKNGAKQYKVEVLHQGKNLINMDSSFISNPDDYYSIQKTENGAEFFANWNSLSTLKRSVPMEKGKTYCLTITGSISHGGADIFMGDNNLSYADKNSYKMKFYGVCGDGEATTRVLKYTATEDCNLTKIIFDGVDNEAKYCIKDFQLERGSEPTDIEEYFEEVKTIVLDKRLLPGEKVEWSEVRKRYVVRRENPGYPAITTGLTHWFDGNDLQYPSKTWKNRVLDADNLDFRNFDRPVQYIGGGCYIKSASTGETNGLSYGTQEAVTMEITLDADLGHSPINIFKGDYFLTTKFADLGTYFVISDKNGYSKSFLECAYGKKQTICFTINNEGIKMYLDGKEVVEAEEIGSFEYTQDTKTLSIESDNSNLESVVINSIKIYDRELTQDEILANYKYELSTNREEYDRDVYIQKSFKGPTTDGLIGWYSALDPGDNPTSVWKNKIKGGVNLACSIPLNSENGFMDGRLVLKDTYKSLVKNESPMTIRSMMIFLTTKSGHYLLDGRSNVANSFAGFGSDVYLMNAYSKAICDGEVEVLGGKGLHLPMDKKAYYIECGSNTTFNRLNLFSRYDETSSPLNCEVYQILFYDRILTREEMLNNIKSYNFCNSWPSIVVPSRVQKTQRTIKEVDLGKQQLFIRETGSFVRVVDNSASVVVNIPVSEERFLSPPSALVANISSTSNLVTLDWQKVIGASSYNVKLNGKIIDSSTTNHWETRNELKGFVSVEAVNRYSISEESESIYVLSVPNETFVSYVKNKYNNGYEFELHFPDTSSIETGYKVYYKVDDRQEQFDVLPSSPGQGSVVVHRFKVPVILDQVAIRAVATNASGESEVVPRTVLLMTDEPKWTYRESSGGILVSWENKIEGVTRYSLSLKINGEELDEVFVSAEGVAPGERMSYIAQATDKDVISVSLAGVIGDIYHIYSKEVTMSKDLDESLKPPSDFKYRRIGTDKVEFSWYDEHSFEEGFELLYSISNGPQRTVYVPSVSITGTGRRYTYTYNFEEEGFINIKLRMKWLLGYSNFTNEHLIYNLPSTGLPPSYIKRESSGDSLTFSWEPQMYVDKYVVKKVDLGIEETFETRDNHITFDFDYSEREYKMDGMWSSKKYTKEKYLLNKTPGHHWIDGLEPIETALIGQDSKSLSKFTGADFICHTETYFKADEDCEIKSFGVNTDDEGFVSINGVKILNTSATVQEISIPLKKGWNHLEVCCHQNNGGHHMTIGTPIFLYDFISGISSDKVDRRQVLVEIRTHFLNEDVSSETTTNIFYPCYLSTEPVTILTTLCSNNNLNCQNTYSSPEIEYDNEIISSSKTALSYLINQNIVTKYITNSYPCGMYFTGVGVGTKYNVSTIVSNNNVEGTVGPVLTTSIKKCSDDYRVKVDIFTRVRLENRVRTEVNKIRIMTIGDSITSGHPGWWAETGTGNPLSQYQHWLNLRLKGEYEIINKGYGSDTTADILARFDKDVLGANAQYCIIQGGTNDLYWAMAEADGDEKYLELKVSEMKDNIIQLTKRCWDNNIVPILGTLIPRTGATGIYKDALYEFNEWIIEYCLGNENIFYVDFFNAGKEKVPPTPLEDPKNPGALNPIYDGDAIYDEYGNLIKQGRGIHPNWEGYRIMAEAIPLTIFKTGDTGLKLYLDEACTNEERYDDSDKINPFYQIDITGLRRNKEKKLIRYIKNVGNSQLLFVAYSYNNYNVQVFFLDEKGKKYSYANGMLPASRVAKIEMSFLALDEDSTANINLQLASREFKIK